MIDVLSTLNNEQRQAVEHPFGKPAMVIAGAGSGKTRVLTTRAAWLIGHDVHPSSILLVTFTNKAALEMIERVERLTAMRLPFSGTFHRLCARILRRNGSQIGISPEFAIVDEDDQVAIMTQIIKDAGLSPKEVKPRVVLSMISGAKNELITPQQYKEFARGKYQERVASLYPRYQRLLAQNDSLDFDDLLMKVVELLTAQPDLKELYQHQFAHILIDEYQDTNTAQLKLTQLLTSPERNLFVVGDFAQAIYSWRGADYRNMLTLKDSYPDIVTYELSQNYRSTQRILDAASHVIANNRSHPVLELWTSKDGGANVGVYSASSDTDEVAHVLKRIERYLVSHPDEQVAVLYRTNAQSRLIEEGLIAAGIPYRLVGGVRFYARKEIKDILAMLRLWVSPHDGIAQERVGKLGKKKLAAYLAWLETERAAEAKKTDENSPHYVLDIIDRILKATDYLSLFDENDEEDAQRLENIAELRSVAANYSDVHEFLETVALVEQEALRKDVNDQEKAQVSLMSVHAAKGLEFGLVCVIGMEEGLFPHSRSLLDPHQMEEERRLCYVAMTRAKEELVITYARRRLLYGQPTASIVSRFVAEIPQKLLDMHGMHTDPRSLQSMHQSKFKRRQTFDDPGIDDFLEGKIDISEFLGV